MASAILVTPFHPTPVGHGGDHRSHQILRDLERCVGRGRVVVVEVGVGKELVQGDLRLRRSRRGPAGRVADKIALLRENPFTLAAGNRFSSRAFLDVAWEAAYTAIARRLEQPAVCVVEHASLVSLVAANRTLGIPTVACVQNIESLDTGDMLSDRRSSTLAAATDFANELRALRSCEARLFISKVETALASGLGAASAFYPYLPRGEVRDGLAAVRLTRGAAPPEPSLFLLLGSAVHRSTRESMAWLLDGIARRGLPAGVRIVVIGYGTERLPGGGSTQNVEARGWVPQEELDSLLATCSAVLVPHRTGFGALTKLPELSCAGIPVLVSRHALAALDPPPGATGLDDDVGAWLGAMETVLRDGPRLVAEPEYGTWAQRQDPALARALAALFGRPGGTGRTDLPESER